MRILITGCDSKFYHSAQTLIASAYLYFDVLHVVDLGLAAAEQPWFRRLPKVRLHPYLALPGEWLGFTKLGCAWKLSVCAQFAQALTDSDCVLYLDAGIVIMHDPEPVFRILDRDGIFMVEDPNQINGTWTPRELWDKLDMTLEEGHAHQICAGLLGFTKHTRVLLQEAYQVSLDEEAFTGCLGWPKMTEKYHPLPDHHGFQVMGSRWDQSVLSVLRLRRHILGQSLYEYAEYRPGYMHSPSIFYVHRGEYYHPFTDLPAHFRALPYDTPGSAKMICSQDPSIGWPIPFPGWTLVQMPPLISIIIPTYNRFEAVQRAIRSAQEQDYPNKEVIVVDDASTDPRYATLTGATVIHLPEKTEKLVCPVIRARNAGIQRSHGQWIAFLDDDDVFLPGKLTAQLRRAEETGLGMCCTDGWYGHGPYHSDRVYDRFYQHHQDRIDIGCTFLPPVFTLELVQKHNCIIQSSVLLQRSIYDQLGPLVDVPVHGTEDYAYWVRVLACTSCAYIDWPYVYYHGSW